MRAVLQRVTGAAVRPAGGGREARVGRGLVGLVGVERDDGPRDVAWMARKVTSLRVFADSAGRFDRSVLDVSGEVLLVSQFTLLGDAGRGTRPSFSAAEAPAAARQRFDDLAGAIAAAGVRVATGFFGEHMLVELENDGPVTLILDSRRSS